MQVNTISDDEPSKLATEYKPEEIAFFRVVVRVVLCSSLLNRSRATTLGGEDHDRTEHVVLRLSHRCCSVRLQRGDSASDHQERCPRTAQELHRQGSAFLLH